MSFCCLVILYNAPFAIRYPPDIRPRPLPGLIFSNIRPRSVTNWISTCGLNRFANCSLRSAECHRVKPTANLVCVISEVTGAQLVTAAQHTLRRDFSDVTSRDESSLTAQVHNRMGGHGTQ